MKYTHSLVSFDYPISLHVETGRLIVNLLISMSAFHLYPHPLPEKHHISGRVCVVGIGGDRWVLLRHCVMGV